MEKYIEKIKIFSQLIKLKNNERIINILLNIKSDFLRRHIFVSTDIVKWDWNLTMVGKWR